MKKFNLGYKIKKEKNCEKRSGGSSVNDICFNRIKFLKLLPCCKSVNSLQRSYLKRSINIQTTDGALNTWRHNNHTYLNNFKRDALIITMLIKIRIQTKYNNSLLRTPMTFFAK